MPRGPTLTRAELVAEVARLVARGATGTLFVRTVDSHTARIVIQAGELVGIAFRATRGVAAIPLLQEIADSSTEFTEGFVFPISTAEQLPSTSALLALLQASSGAAAAALAHDGACRAALEVLLEEFIGSYASQVMREISDDPPGPWGGKRIDWAAAVDRMAAEGDAGQVNEFIQRARKLVGS